MQTAAHALRVRVTSVVDVYELSPAAALAQVCDFLPLRAACGSLPATCRWLRDVLCGVAIRGVTVSGSSTSSSGANISANAALGAGSPAAISGYGGPSTAARTAPAGSAVAGAGSRGWLSSAAAGQPQLGGAALPAEWWRRKAEEDLRVGGQHVDGGIGYLSTVARRALTSPSAPTSDATFLPPDCSMALRLNALCAGSATLSAHLILRDTQ